MFLVVFPAFFQKKQGKEGQGACLKNQQLNLASTDLPLQRIKEKNRCGASVSTPHRRYGHRLRAPFLRTRFRDSYLVALNPKHLLRLFLASKVIFNF